jgi:multicomponent K+:H+ antiporter subunit E
MQKYFPAPRFSILLLLIWLCLNATIQPLVVLGGICLGISLPLLWHTWLPFSPPKVRILPACALFALFIKDIMFANGQMAHYIALVSYRPSPPLSARLIGVPLASTDLWVNAILANMISLTPSTLTADIDEESAMLWVHAIHCEDPVSMVEEIKTRYETRLCHIFGVETPILKESGV